MNSRSSEKNSCKPLIISIPFCMVRSHAKRNGYY
jgi:hypothetical protein